MAKFPKILFVKTEKDGSTEYFVADASADALVEMSNKTAIATYQLVEVRDAESGLGPSQTFGVASFSGSRKRMTESKR